MNRDDNVANDTLADSIADSTTDSFLVSDTIVVPVAESIFTHIVDDVRLDINVPVDSSNL